MLNINLTIKILLTLGSVFVTARTSDAIFNPEKPLAEVERKAMQYQIDGLVFRIRQLDSINSSLRALVKESPAVVHDTVIQQIPYTEKKTFQAPIAPTLSIIDSYIIARIINNKDSVMKRLLQQRKDRGESKINHRPISKDSVHE